MRCRPFRLIAVLALAGVVVAACGDDDDDTAATTTTTAPADDSDSGDGDDGPDTVEVTLVDYAYEDLPSSVDAGTMFTLRNESEGELHEFVAFRLADDETRTIAEIAALPPEELMPLVGEPAAVLLATPGSSDTIPAVGGGVISEPGRYGVICVIPTGADPAEYLEKAQTSDGPPDVAGGPPHITQGMFAEFTVT